MMRFLAGVNVMRFLLQLLLLIAVGCHAVWGCASHHCHSAGTCGGVSESACTESGACENLHSHGPFLPSDCSACVHDDCIWIVDAERTELRLEATASPLLASPAHEFSPPRCRLVAAAMPACQSRPLSLHGWKCVWLI